MGKPLHITRIRRPKAISGDLFEFRITENRAPFASLDELLVKLGALEDFLALCHFDISELKEIRKGLGREPVLPLEEA